MLSEVALRLILRRLAPADLLRAALACHRWRRAARVLPRAPPHLGYFFHPSGVPDTPPGNPTDKTFYPAVFLPLDASSPRLDLALSPGAARGFSITDVYLGLVVLSRAHPSRISFEAVLFTVDGHRPRACTWRAMPRAEDVEVDFYPWWFESRCVRAARNIYWHICNSSRALNPLTLEFSYLPVPAELGDTFKSYRIGETVEDGRLRIAVAVDQELQIWVRVGTPGGMIGGGYWRSGCASKRSLIRCRGYPVTELCGTQAPGSPTWTTLGQGRFSSGLGGTGATRSI
jgi:hypothetical protein